MQLSSPATRLSFAILGSSSLATTIVALGGTSASAQITIQSTGTLSGTIQLPNNNPNFNRNITRVDTDSSGAYYRNIGSKNSPDNVLVYQSNYVKMQTRNDGSLHYFVDFKGIPVISLNGILGSPALSGGQLTPYSYQGKVPGTKFQGVVQDEFGLTRAFYTGVVTDPKTGLQYQGTFQVSGQGPRYSDRNGGLSPTVFDFKSDLPGQPTVKSWQMNNVPLVRLTITIPANATPITPSSNNTPAPTPVVNTPAPTPVVSSNTPTAISMSIPVTDNSSVFSEPVPQAFIAPTPITDTDNSDFSSPSTTSNVEFSSGNSFTPNSAGLEASTVAANLCSQDSVNCRPKLTTSKQAIGPRSRVFVR